MFTLLVFLIFGGVMVPQALEHLTLDIGIYSVLCLTLIRMLPVALSLIGTGLRPASLAFLGWFGPRGLASIVFVLLILENGGVENGALMETIVMFTVLLGAIVHGVTAYPFAARYDRLVGLEGEAAEHANVTEMPARVRHIAAMRL